MFTCSSRISRSLEGNWRRRCGDRFQPGTGSMLALSHFPSFPTSCGAIEELSAGDCVQQRTLCTPICEVVYASCEQIMAYDGIRPRR